ncbi:F-box/LRR-repeat protein 25 [Morus notabilis]|uniref:F-box/LRR-repeat protein 25 n=1 Tax=Morus notabilis TaxID=981085 RepID=UPI000CED7975|nr:F-box/LRR-repeat protein 25 [Morus notabilis]
MATKRVKPNFRDRNTSAALDRISRLPDPVIHRILSFIPTIDVVRMSLLSKRWRRMWYSVPSLEFSDADITHSAFHSRKRFCNFVDKCLKHREASMRYISDSFITRFKLDIEYYGGRSALDNWLSFVIRSNVEEFDLRAKPKFEWSYISDSFYCLPEAVLSAGSLNVLKLEGLKLNGACSVSLPSLKSLSLKAAKLDDHILCGLVTGCPSLDEFFLKNCKGLSNPRISSLSLKFLEIRYSSCQTLKALIFPENLRRICGSPWLNLKNLKVKTYCRLTKKNKLRDALYWLSPKLETLAIEEEKKGYFYCDQKAI